MKVVRFQTDGGQAHTGIMRGEEVHPLLGMSVIEALASLRENDNDWGVAMKRTPVPCAHMVLLPPVENPGAFLDFYTFEEHARTARAKRGLDMPPEWYQYPVWYNGSPRCFTGDGTTVVFPDHENKKDYELEIAVVIKKKCFKASKSEAAGYIGGYTIVNDFSARELQEKVMRIGLGPAKAKDFNTGIGPCIVTPGEIGDPRNLKMRAWVNGELWSEGNSGASHFTFEEMIAFASEYQTLYPGDVLASGTVGGGCGLELGRFLKTGDQVTLEIENIGTLTHWIG